MKFSGGSSVRNLVLVILQHVIGFAPVENMNVREVRVCFSAAPILADPIFPLFSLPAAEETALDDFNDEGCCLFLAHLRIEATSDEKTNRFLFTWYRNHHN